MYQYRYLSTVIPFESFASEPLVDDPPPTYTTTQITRNQLFEMSLPKSYKALQQKEKGKPFDLIDVELKEPKEGYVVVKVLACGGKSKRQPQQFVIRN